MVNLMQSHREGEEGGGLLETGELGKNEPSPPYVERTWFQGKRLLVSDTSCKMEWDDKGMNPAALQAM